MELVLADSARSATTDRGDVILQLVDVVRTYRLGEEIVHALDSVSMSVRRGEFLAIMGRSGSGKSTMLNVIGCLDRPTSGSIILDGEDVTRLPASRLPRIRREKLGFIFQHFNLIPTLTALENVMLPMEYAGVPEHLRRERAIAALEAVELADRIHHQPSQLSGGQQQRVSIARALSAAPAVILADEPTGALDSHSAELIIGLMRDFNRTQGQTFIIVTHDPLVSGRTDRVIRLSDGRIASDEVQQRV